MSRKFEEWYEAQQYERTVTLETGNNMTRQK